MAVTLASGRSQLNSSDWTFNITPNCGCLTSKSLYFTLQAVNNAGVNVPIISNLVEIDTNDRLTISILETAKLSGEGWTHFIIGCTDTNDPTTTNQIAKIPCCAYDALGNIDLLTPVSFPINIVFEYDHQLSLGEMVDTVAELPSTNLISGIRYGVVEKGNNVYEYNYYSSATIDNNLVLGATTGRWLLRDQFSPYIANAQYLGGCSVDLLNVANFDNITIPNYEPNGGNSPIVKYYLVNDTGSDIPEGYAIFLNVQVGGYNKTDLFDKKIEYYIEGFVDTATGILRTDYYGTSDALQFLNIQKTYSSRFPTLILEDVVKNGEAVLLTLILRCDLLELQGKLPNTQIQILPEMLPMSGTFNPLGGLFEKGIILAETGFDKRRVLPNLSLSVKYQSGVGIVKDFNFWRPSSGKLTGLTANSTNKIYINKDGDLYIDTAEASDSTLRAIVKCEVKESILSSWSNYSTVAANSALLVTVNYPCDANLNAIIRSSYPDVIANSTGIFNANKVNIYIQRQSDGQIRKFSNLNVSALDSQVFTITNWTSGTIVTQTPTEEASFYNPENATFTESINNGNLTATDYRVAYSLVWDGNTASDISHAVADGCITESLLTGEQVFGSSVYNTVAQIRAISDLHDGQEVTCLTNQNSYKYFSTGIGDDDGFDVLIPVTNVGRWININRQDYFAKIYKRGELQEQVEGLNFVDDRFDIELFDDKLNVKLNDISTLRKVDQIPDVNFDCRKGYKVGDSVQLTIAPYTIYDCLNDAIGAASWRIRGNVSEDDLGTSASLDTGVAGGICPLNGSAKVDESYLPSYVDDVLEYANLAAFPGTGETGKIYVTLDTDKTYRWSGSTYVAIGSDGLPSQTGNNGKWLTTNGTTASWGSLATVATSGSYADLSSKPTLGTAAALDVGTTANKVVQLDNSGKLPAVDGSQLTGIVASGSGHTIQDEGTPLTTRANLNFVGSGVTVTDDSGNNASVVTINALSPTVSDSTFRIQDNSDATKQIAFEASEITAGTTRTLTSPDASGQIALIDTTSLTDKDLFYWDASSKLFKRIAIGTTGQALIAQPSNNPPYQFATATGGGREVLTANRTYYVRTDGSDSNDGLAATAGGAFLTIQKAIDVAATLDLSIYDVTILIGTGTFTITSTLIIKKGLGSGKLYIKGATTTASNHVISGTLSSPAFNDGLTGLTFISAYNLSLVEISYLQFNCNQNNLFNSSFRLKSSSLAIRNCIFNPTGTGGGYTLWAQCFSSALIETLTFSGTAGFMLVVEESEIFSVDNTTLTNSGTYSSGIHGQSLGKVRIYCTLSGTWVYDMRYASILNYKTGQSISGSVTNGYAVAL